MTSITPSHSQLIEINTYHTNIILIPLTIKHSHIHCVGLNITESERAIQCKPEENKHFLFFCNLIKNSFSIFLSFQTFYFCYFMLISCSFNSFRINGHYISARFQIIWRPNLWLVSCTALVSFIEFIFHPFFSPLLLHLPLFLCFLSYYYHYHWEAPDLSAPACLSFPPFILSFLHGYVLPPPYHLPGVYCCLFILLEVIFILSLLSGCNFPYLRLCTAITFL